MNRRNYYDPLEIEDDNKDEDFVISSKQNGKNSDSEFANGSKSPLRNDRELINDRPVRRSRLQIDYSELILQSMNVIDEDTSEFMQVTLQKYKTLSISEKGEETIDLFFEESLRYFEYSLDKVKAYWTIPLKRIIDEGSELRVQFFETSMTNQLTSLIFPSGWKHRYRLQGAFEKDAYGVSKMYIGIECVLDEQEKNNPEWSREVRLEFRITMKFGLMDMDKGFNKTFNAKNFDCGIQVPVKLTREINLLLNDCLIVECSLRENRSLRNSSSRYMGIINSGNLCYMNSVIQTLFHLSSFQRLIFQMPSTDGFEQMPIIAALQKVFYNLRYSQKPVSTTELIVQLFPFNKQKKSFGWDKKEANIQQDVQEFCLLFMAALEKKMDSFKGFQGRTSQFFEGSSLNYLRCIDVPYKSERIEKFTEVQLMVSGMTSLYDSLDAYVQEEQLDEDNKIDTDDYGKQNAVKGVKFNSTPPVLMLQLKRFEYNYQKESMVKITDYYEYYDEIDMEKYLVKPIKSETRYKLFSVLVHNGGGASSGHYYSFIRPTPGLGGEWYKFNDDIVDLCDPEEVFENNFGGCHTEAKLNTKKEIEATDTQNLATAYMLVYIRVDKIKEILKPVTDDEVSKTLITEITANKKIEEERKRKAEEYIKIYISAFELLKETGDDGSPGLFFYKTGPKDDQYLAKFFKNKRKRMKLYFKKGSRVGDLIQFISDYTKIPVDEIMIWKMNTKDEQITPVTTKKFLTTPTSLNLLCNQLNQQITKSIFYVHAITKANYPLFFRIVEPYKSEFFGIKCKNSVELVSYPHEDEALEKPMYLEQPIELRILENPSIELREFLEERRCLVILKAYSCKNGRPTIRFWNQMNISREYNLQDLIEDLEKLYNKTFENYTFYREEKKKSYTLEKLDLDTKIDDGSADFGFVIIAEILRQDQYIPVKEYYDVLSRRVWVTFIDPSKNIKRDLIDGDIGIVELLNYISGNVFNNEVAANKILLKCKWKFAVTPSPVPVSEYNNLTLKELVKHDERINVEISKIETDLIDKTIQISLSYYSPHTNELTPEEELFLDKEATIKEIIEEIEKRQLFEEARVIDNSIYKEKCSLRILVLEKKINRIFGRANPEAKISDYLSKYRFRVEMIPDKFEISQGTDKYYPIFGVQLTRDREYFSNPFLIFTKKNITGQEFSAKMFKLMSNWSIDLLGKEIKTTEESFSKLMFVLKVDANDTHNYARIENNGAQPFMELDEGTAKKFALEIIHPFNMPSSKSPVQMQIRA